jgi:hypothetical protein
MDGVTARSRHSIMSDKTAGATKGNNAKEHSVHQQGGMAMATKQRHEYYVTATDASQRKFATIVVGWRQNRSILLIMVIWLGVFFCPAASVALPMTMSGNDSTESEAGQITITSTYPSKDFAAVHDLLQASLSESTVVLAFAPVKTPQASPLISITIAGNLARTLVEELVDFVYDKYVKPKELKSTSISYYVVDADRNLSFVLPKERERLLKHLSDASLSARRPSSFYHCSEMKMAQLAVSSTGESQDALVKALKEMATKGNVNALKSLLWIVRSIIGGEMRSAIASANTYEELLSKSQADYLNLFYLYTYCWAFESERKGLRFKDEAASFIRIFRQYPTSHILELPDNAHSEAIKPFLAATITFETEEYGRDILGETTDQRDAFFYRLMQHYVAGATVVHGNNANMKLQIGAGLRHKEKDMRGLWENVFLHEFGHILLQEKSALRVPD